MKMLAIVGLCMLAVSVRGANHINYGSYSKFYKWEGDEHTLECTVPSWPAKGSMSWMFSGHKSPSTFLTWYDDIYVKDDRAQRYTIVNNKDARTSTLTIKNLKSVADSGKYFFGLYEWNVGWTQWYCKYEMGVFPVEDMQYEGQCFTFHGGDCSRMDFQRFICNSACKPPVDCSSGPYTRCGPLPDAEKKQVVDTHNELRQLIASGGDVSEYGGTTQPIATDMYELVYDDEIARLAQGWAEDRIWGHDCGDCRMGGPGSKYSGHMGQNGAMMSTKEDAWKWATIMWFKEIKHYDYDTASSKDGGEVLHYTQVVWSTTKYIGCGVLQGNWVEKPSSIDSGVFMCNYYPTGNWKGEKPYSTTDKCPNGNSDKYPNLCKH